MQITAEELRAIEAPAPTKTWNPIPHGQILNQVNTVLEKMGVSTLNTIIDIDKKGNNAFVTHTIESEDMSERQTQIGWRNSISKDFSLGFTSGTNVVVCSNLVFSGQWMEFKRHTNTLQLERVQEMALSGIHQTLNQSQELADWHDQMKEIKRSKKEADHIFMNMIRKQVIAANQTLNLVNAYDEEVQRYGESLYTIYNCATQTFRNTSLPNIEWRSKKLNELMTNNIGIAA